MTAEWSVSELNRGARVYRLTRAGRKQLGLEVTAFERLVAGITKVLRASES